MATSPSPMQRPGAIPRPPTRPAASSERMSPNMLVVTTTSKVWGSRTSRMAKVSTMTSSTSTSGYSAAALRHSSTNMPQPSLNTVSLWTSVSFRRRWRASSSAAFATRRLPGRDRHVVRRAELAAAGDHVAVGLKTLVVLPHDDEVDAVVEAADVRVGAGRAHVGEQVEVLAQDRVGIDSGW